MNNAVDINASSLLVDVGNTRIKALSCQIQQSDACFNKDALWVTHESDFDRSVVKMFEQFSQPKDVLVSNVAGDQARHAIEKFCMDKWEVKPKFAHVERSKHGIQNSYVNLDELGVDRWMAIQGARQLFEGAIIVIGCGTAITVDLLSGDDVFVGGAILPGLELTASSLSQTDGIPQFDFQEYNHVLGASTADCVRVGVINACAGGIEKTVASIIEQFSGVPIKILASGGAAKSILSATNLKFEYDANLVLRGLQRVTNKRLN